MSVTREQFVKQWNQLSEAQDAHTVETAWRRYQQVHDPAYATEHEGLSDEQFQASLEAFMEDANVSKALGTYMWPVIPANSIPWHSLSLPLKPGEKVSIFAAGRVWRSKLLDMWLRPQFALWFKIGVNGAVFNSTGDTNTFEVQEEGELYVCNQFPGQFGEPLGGRLASPLRVYENAEGRFQLLIIHWKDGTNPERVLEEYVASSREPISDLVVKELERMRRDAQPSVSDDWRLLWFLGTSSIYSLQQRNGERCMHCRPHLNTGILQKHIKPNPMDFRAGTMVSWDWLIPSLPSRLPENLTFTHDYLSVAFEFENGRDLTYTWSWELPHEFGYWCPLPAWADREYHVVIRSGIKGLGEWISEERDLYGDYVKYIEEGKEDEYRMPTEIVRVWFIAGNRWQRLEGEMFVKRLQIRQGNRVVNLL